MDPEIRPRQGLQTWHWLLIAAVGIIAICCSGILFFGGRTFVNSGQEATESRAFADEAFSAIASDWSYETFRKYESPMLTQSPQASDTPKYLQAFSRKLGKYQSHEPFQLKNWKLQSYTSTGTFLDAQLASTGKFEKGEAAIQLRVVKKDGKWGILAYRLNSDVFLQ